MCEGLELGVKGYTAVGTQYTELYTTSHTAALPYRNPKQIAIYIMGAYIPVTWLAAMHTHKLGSDGCALTRPLLCVACPTDHRRIREETQPSCLDNNKRVL